MEFLHSFVQSASILTFIVFGLSLALQKNKTVTHWLSMALLLNCLVFQLTYLRSVQAYPVVFFTLFPLAVAFPFVYTLFCEQYFSDDSFGIKKLIKPFTALYVISLFLYLLPYFSKYDYISNFGYVISAGVLIYATVLAVKGYREDLIEKRRKVRTLALMLNCLIGFSLLISFFSYHPLRIPDSLTSISLIAECILIISLFDIRIKLAVPTTAKAPEKPVSKSNRQLLSIAQKVESLMESDKVYRQEGLTITQLSAMIDTKEYLVRKAINKEAGYANFNQFLNHYKIREAQDLLRNQPDMSMKEIAYHLGYPNPSAFNRVFKQKMGISPSEFKKEQDS